MKEELCYLMKDKYLKYLLKDRLKCTEDLAKRRMVTDANITEKSEVEAQYTIEFMFNNVKHDVHMTFYYTKCSIWIQGSSTKINNLTVFRHSLLGETSQYDCQEYKSRMYQN